MTNPNLTENEFTADLGLDLLCTGHKLMFRAEPGRLEWHELIAHPAGTANSRTKINDNAMRKNLIRSFRFWHAVKATKHCNR